MFAADFFLINRNLTDHLVSWPTAFTLWIVFGMAFGVAGDEAYNRVLPRATKPFQRVLALFGIYAGIFLIAFIFSTIVFWIASVSDVIA